MAYDRAANRMTASHPCSASLPRPNSAPAMGRLDSVPKLATIMAVAKKRPYSLASHSWPMHTGYRPRLLPEAKPKVSANTMSMGRDPPAGSQKARTVMTHSAFVSVITLKRPNRSAQNPGRKRPKKEPALNNARSVYASCESWPWALAYETMYVSGVKIPHSMNQTPAQQSVNLRSLKSDQSGITRTG